MNAPATMFTDTRRRIGFIATLAAAVLIGGASGLAAPAGYLTGPAQGDAADIARDYVRAHRGSLGLTEEDLQDWILSDRYVTKHNGVTHLYLHQRLRGIEVFNGLINANVDREGRLISLGNRFVGRLGQSANARQPVLTAAAAVLRAAADLGLAAPSAPRIRERRGGPAREVLFEGGAVSREPIPVKLMYLPVKPGEVRLVWDLRIVPDEEHAWQMEVDAVTGEVVQKMDLVQHDSYKVYEWPAESPNHVAAPLPPGDGRTVATEGAADPNASPSGWHDLDGAPGPDTITTQGNNVWAYTDLDQTDSPTPLVDTQPSSGTRDFDFPLDLTMDPPTYRDAVVTNLFYWNNIIHDIHYLYGFDEASGNFQLNNYGRGGLGNDFVKAEAQDGSGTNNANFLTPPEGTPPRMQMFVWTARPVVEVNAGAAIAGDSYPAAPAAFGRALDSTGDTGDVVLVDDGVGNRSDACEPIQNDLSGRIALIDRGTCEFGFKVKNAEDHGAKAAIVANNQGDGLVIMAAGATGGQVTIPSVFIGQSNGQKIKDALAQGAVNITMRKVGADRDSDLDNGVIIHEYGHGVSIRLTGGPSMVTCLSGQQQAGEGWSDFHALGLTQRAGADGTEPRGIATYLTFEDPPVVGLGIRPFPYSTDMSVNPQTYGDLSTGTLSVPHGVGSVWATTLWEMYWALVNGVPSLGLPGHGFRENLYDTTDPRAGNQIALQLVMDGLKLQPCNPTFLDARDAILQADLASFPTGGGSAHKCHIWWAFAKRGMGVNAMDGGGTLNVTEDFSLPPECTPGPCVVPPAFSGADGVVSATDGSCRLTVHWSAATEHCSTGTVTYSVYRSTDPAFAPDAGSLRASGLTGTSYEDTAVDPGVRYHYIVRATDGLGNTDQNLARRSEVPVGTLDPGGTFFDDAGDAASVKFSPGQTAGNTWSIRPAGGVNNSKVYATSAAGDYPNSACMALESDTIYLGPNPTLSFSSRWEIEPTWDGGIVEVATADGNFSDWTKLDTIIYPFVMGGPLGDPACQNPGLADGQPAFSGSSAGQTVQFSGSLDAYANMAVRIRFLFSSDGGTTEAGWFADNIKVDDVNTPRPCGAGPNGPPDAVDDTATTEEGAPVTINVLANDSDPDGDDLTVTNVTQPAHGSAADNGDGTVTYTPAAGFSGVDAFSYTADDGHGGSDTAAVTVTVRPLPLCDEIDDSDEGVESKGGWHRREDARASFGGYLRRMGTKAGGKGSAPTVRVTFTGDAVTYFYVKSDHGGTADILIDGALRETLSYGPGLSGPENPTFGHSRSYTDLGSGQHELKIVHRTGVAYVDGFAFSCESPASADASAVTSRSETQTSQASASEGALIQRSVMVGPLDREVSVVVEGGAAPLTVRLLDPSGNLVASGEALIAGLTASGLDALVSGDDLWTVQVLGAPGSFQTLEISVARTVSVPAATGPVPTAPSSATTGSGSLRDGASGDEQP